MKILCCALLLKVTRCILLYSELYSKSLALHLSWNTLCLSSVKGFVLGFKCFLVYLKWQYLLLIAYYLYPPSSVIKEGRVVC